MSIWARLMSYFASGSNEAPSSRRLSASSETALAASIEGLLPGDRGWITFQDARDMFSALDDEYAFGEMDDDGKRNLASFAASHRADPDFRPVEGAFTSSEMQIRKATGPISCTSRAGCTPRTDTHNRIDHDVRTPEAAIDKGAPQGLRSGGGAF